MLKLLFNITEGFLMLLFELLKTIISCFKKKNQEYSASFIHVRKIISSKNKGFCLDGKRQVSISKSYEGSLVSASTGLGKTSVVLLPSLYTMCSSLIVHDANGELADKSLGKLASEKVDSIILNFANPSISSGYNPLSYAKDYSDIQKLASLFVKAGAGQNSKDQFWLIQATGLIATVMAALVKADEQYHNMMNVRMLITQLATNRAGLDRLFSKYADRKLFEEYKSFLAYDDKVLSGVIAMCKTALQIFNDDKVARVTSVNTFTFDQFRKKRSVLFIQNSIAEQSYYAPLTSVFFEQFFSYILSRIPDKDEQDVFLLIDEAGSLHLPTLPLFLANSRKTRCGSLLLIQDFNQLIHNFGKYEAEAIKSNTYAKLYFAGQSLETSRDLEAILGKVQFEDERGRKVVRSLMTNDEIRTIDIHKGLLICGNLSPSLVTLTPYFKRSKFSEYSQLPKPEIMNVLGNDEIPLLNLNDLGDETI